MIALSVRFVRCFRESGWIFFQSPRWYRTPAAGFTPFTPAQRLTKVLVWPRSFVSIDARRRLHQRTLPATLSDIYPPGGKSAMPWIRSISPERATGTLASMYQAAESRAGRVFQILRVQSINPQALQSGIGLYQTLMFGESPLSRAQREMIAVVVSRANECHY